MGRYTPLYCTRSMPWLHQKLSGRLYRSIQCDDHEIKTLGLDESPSNLTDDESDDAGQNLHFFTLAEYRRIEKMRCEIIKVSIFTVCILLLPAAPE